MLKTERKVIEFIKSNVLFFAIGILLFISLKIRFSGINYESADYLQFIKPWLNQIKMNGGFLSLKHEIGDYNIPYMFILTVITYLPEWIKPIFAVKLVSIIFDYICALSVVAIIYHLFGRTKSAIFPSLIGLCIVLFLPTVLLNSAFWGQSDSVYTAFVLLCILFLIKEKYSLAFLFFSIALAFKLQAIFIFPVLIILYFVKNKFSILNFLMIPAIFIGMDLPAFLAGRPFQETMKIYPNQTKEYQSLFVNYSGFYTLFKGEYKEFRTFAIFLTIAIFGIMAFLIIYKKYDISKANIVPLSMWSVYVCLMFLPAMHERYGFAIDILSVIYFVVKRKKIYIPLVINFVSLIDYCEFLFGVEVFNNAYLTLANLVVLLIVTLDILKDLKNDTNMNSAAENNTSKTKTQIHDTRKIYKIKPNA